MQVHASDGMPRSPEARLRGQLRGLAPLGVPELVRGVTRGILGVALIQSLLCGAGLFLAGVPAAGVWTLCALVLAVVQLGVGLVMVPASVWVFAHSETLADQDYSVALVKRLGGIDLKHAEGHREIIRRFGRFQHRNPILGRPMLPEEQAYLDNGGFKG